MRITVDMQGLQTPDARDRGIGRYSEQLIINLVELAKEHDVVLLYNRNFGIQNFELIYTFFERFEKVSWRGWKPLKGSSYLAGNSRARKLSKEIYSCVVESLHTDVLLVLSPFSGFSCEAIYSLDGNYRSVSIFYDAIPHIFASQYLTDANVRDWYYECVDNLSKAYGIAAISESALADLKKYHNVFPQNELVLYGGLDRSRTKNPLNVQEYRESFILSVLGEDPRKNKLGLIKAYKILREKYNLDYELKIVYKQSEFEKIANQELLRKYNLSEYVTFLDYVPDDHLFSLYRTCSLFVFPSHYEGLGLPVLEALSMGAVVVAGQNSSITEILDDSDLCFDSRSDEEMALIMFRALTDESLKVKCQEVRARALERFDWKKSASDLNSMFLNICSPPSPSSPQKAFKKIAWISPGPGLKSGISDYSSEMTKYLSEIAEVHWFCSSSNSVLLEHMASDSHNVFLKPLTELLQNPFSYDYVIYNFGNSSFHVQELRMLRRIPGVVILHDYFLGGMYWSELSRTLNIQEFGEKARELSGEHAALKDSSYPVHQIINNFPMNSEVVSLSLGVVMHSEATKVLFSRDFAPTSSSRESGIFTLPHLREIKDQLINSESGQTRVRRSGFAVGVFGIVAETKFCFEILEAWETSARSENDHLYFIGECSIAELHSAIKRKGLGNCVTIVGRVDSEEYRSFLTTVDFAVQLRKNWRGESSGAILDVLASGVPTITNAVGSFDEIPNDVVLKLSPVPSIAEIRLAIESLLKNHSLRDSLSKKSISFIKDTRDPKKCSLQLMTMLDFAPGFKARQEAWLRIGTLFGSSSFKEFLTEDEIHFEFTSNVSPYYYQKTLYFDVALFKNMAASKEASKLFVTNLTELIKSHYPSCVRFVDSSITGKQLLEIRNLEGWLNDANDLSVYRRLFLFPEDILITTKKLDLVCHQVTFPVDELWESWFLGMLKGKLWAIDSLDS